MPQVDLNFDFRNEQQREFCFSRARNNCFSGGFGNGKTWAACLRHFLALSTFPFYRTFIARETYADLRKTTMATFFKICPLEFVARHNDTEGLTTLKNGSEIIWAHLDAYDEQSLRGLEVNSALIDQAEETTEEIFLVLDSRIGRWDKAIVPKEILAKNPAWPRTPYGRPRIPNFIDILCNPDTTFHWIYRRFHPDSVERRKSYFFIEAQTDESMNDPETIREMKSRDPEWVAKYFKGLWGASNAQIHYILPQSLLNYNQEFVEALKSKGALYRVLDHGDTGITCCLWAASWKGVYIFYKEYYSSERTISAHRESITELSLGEEYQSSFADPSIFRKQSQRDGGFWTVADEYSTTDLDVPSLFWIKADNNEFATRNRINELLKLSSRFRHPITGESPAPGIYFIKRSENYSNGCFHCITQTQAQRRKYLGSDNGKPIFVDDRDESIPDHAYDPVRYFVAMHGVQPKEVKRRPPINSFAHYNAILKNPKFASHLAAKSVGYGDFNHYDRRHQ